jgi:hypothetical protein
LGFERTANPARTVAHTRTVERRDGRRRVFNDETDEPLVYDDEHAALASA